MTLQPIRRYGFDAAILFSDILVIPDALGQTVRFEENVGPLLFPSLRDKKSIESLKPHQIMAHLAPVLETVRLLKANLPVETALIGFAGAPWTVASYMVAGEGVRDQLPAREFAYRDPDGFAQLIELLVGATVEYLSAQVNAGAEALQLFDTWAGSLSEREFQRWCVAPTREIVQRLRASFPDVPIIGFPRGVGPLYADFCRQTKVTAVSIDHGLPLDWARKHLQPDVIVQGNLDPLLLVAGGEAMRNEAQRILDILARSYDGARFIFNLGHGIVPQTPPEHVQELVALIKQWRP